MKIHLQQHNPYSIAEVVKYIIHHHNENANPCPNIANLTIRCKNCPFQASTKCILATSQFDLHKTFPEIPSNYTTLYSYLEDNLPEISI